MRCDPQTLALARSRVRLASGEAVAGHGAVPARLLARRGRRVPVPAVAALDARLTTVLAEPARLARLVARAAAICHAPTLAKAISAADRARVADLVDAETRAVALAHRALARQPDVPLADLGAALAAAAARIRGALRSALPEDAAFLVPDPVETPGPGDAEALDAALAAEARP